MATRTSAVRAPARSLSARAPSLVWLRRDLRLADNPALDAAIRQGGPVIPVYVWAPEEEGEWAPGGAARWWLHGSLTALADDLRAAGSRLVVRRGPSRAALLTLLEETGAGAVYWNRCYEPALIARDQTIKESLRTTVPVVESFNGSLLNEPWTIENKSGRPFQVFSPYWRTCLAGKEPAEPLAAPGRIPPPADWPESLPLEALELEPRIDWAGGLRAAWRPGSRGGIENLKSFLAEAFAGYDQGRNDPGSRGTSRLSPHLHYGEISPRQVWHTLREGADRLGASATPWRRSQFVAELGWREFAYHLLYHFPHTPRAPLRLEFRRFPWRANQAWLEAWQRGRTGFPLVDAGMRELWSTGWMHNRVRMVVASFLVKHLLISWEEGARWFWDTLVDADLASNTLGWQWTAGCGADAAPYFRIFNPVSQGERHDPEGRYVRRWVPELAALPDKWIHRPWEAPPELLRQLRIEIGRDYPAPIVSHAIAREVALEAYARIRSTPTTSQSDQ